MDLAPLTDPDLVAETVMTVLGVGDVAGASAADRLLAHLVARDLLLVLDNCEHVVEACAELAVAVLARCPGVYVLATSREALGVAGEVVWQVPSMGADGVALFVERATAARPNFAVDDEALLAEICDRLDGIPLAIELAAARSRSLTPGQMLGQLEDRFRLLTGRTRGTLGRQRTLEASVTWSHELLSEDERLLFRRLAVFAGGFTLDAAEAVASAAAPGLDAGAILDLLDALVAKSMVAVVDDAEGRYRLLETLRAFAATELERAGETATAREAHLGYFLEFLRAGGLGLDGTNLERVRRFVGDQDNCRAAADWCLSGTDIDRSVELVRHLLLALAGRGRYREGHDWGRRAVELPGLSARPAAVQIDALMTLGAGQTALSDVAALSATAARASTLLDAEAGARSRAQALHLQARLAMFRGDPAAARAALDAAQPFAEEAGEVLSLLDLSCCRLIVAMRSDDLVNARGLVDAALAVARRYDSHPYLVLDHCYQSVLALRAGDFPTAGAAASECFRLAAGPVGFGGGMNTGVLAFLQLFGGNPDRALELVDPVIPIVLGDGGYGFLAYLMTIRGRALAALGAPDAEAALVEALATAERLQDPWQVAHAAVACARFFVDHDAKVTDGYVETARATGAAVGSPYVRAAADHLDALLAAARGELARAEDLAHAALAVHVAQGYALDAVDVLETLACLAVRSESQLEAARLFGAATARREELGYRLVPPDTASTRDALLSDEDCAAAAKEGASLGVDAAVAYASRARGERGRPSFGWAALTPMELDVARLVAEGVGNAEIGRRLFVSVNTIKTHLQRTYAKLGLTSRAELAAEVTRRGG
ncbi:MAG: LuxR C-terminal-related transcriptional regulator [Sporichthyaceae bacterium]